MVLLPIWLAALLTNSLEHLIINVWLSVKARIENWENGMRAMIGMRGIRVGMWGIRVEMM